MTDRTPDSKIDTLLDAVFATGSDSTVAGARVTYASLTMGAQRRADERLRELFPDATPSVVVQLSEFPPAWIEILLPYAGWGAIAVVWSATAKPFLTKMFEKLGERTGDGIYDGLKGLADTARGCTPATIIAEAVAGAAEAEGRPVALRLTAPDVDPSWGPTFALPEDSTATNADAVAYFAAVAPGVERAVRELRAGGARPLGGFRVEPHASGFALRWTDQATMATSSLAFDLDGGRVEEGL